MHLRIQGGTLLIWSSQVMPRSQIFNLGASDHKVVSMDLPLSASNVRPRWRIRFRNLKSVRPEVISVDLQQLCLLNFSSVNYAVEYYNKTPSSILDFYAPGKTRIAPWFLRKLKSAGRAIERHYKTSGLTSYLAENTKKSTQSPLERHGQSIILILLKNSPGNSKHYKSS